MDLSAHQKFTHNAIDRQNNQLLKQAFDVLKPKLNIDVLCETDQASCIQIAEQFGSIDNKLNDWKNLWISYINCIINKKLGYLYKACLHLTKTTDQLTLLIRRYGLQQGFWFYSLLGNLCRDLRLMTYQADIAAEYNVYDSNGKRLLLCEDLALDCISRCFRLSVNFDRQLYNSSRPLLVTLANQNLKVYSHLGNFTLVKSLIKTVEERSQLKLNSSIADQVTYNYYHALQILNSSSNSHQMVQSMKLLEWAYKKMPVNECRLNRRLILLRLIPLKILFDGKLPSKALFEKECIDEYAGICAALKLGNIAQYNRLMKLYQPVLFRYGTITLFDEIRLLVYRQFIFRIELILKESKYNVQIFVDLICIMSDIQCEQRLIDNEDDMNSSADIEFISIVFELMRRGLLKAKLASSKKLRLLFRRKEAFPKPCASLLSPK
ncbi:hypothetical protein GJ496_006103 [Pomphorhynchus laevis]|nr:hypothetical protein GJ496_006103 [Pomphorhynchus laevis]